VFDDAVIDDAVKGAVSGIFAATGQTCIAGSRLLVQDEHPRRVRRASWSLREDRAHGQSDGARTPRSARSPRRRSTRRSSPTSRSRKSEGASCLLGGGPARARSAAAGWFVEPTIFTGVDNAMRIAQEEVFGPVLSIIPFKDEEEAVEIANDVVFGLAPACGPAMRPRDRMSERCSAGTVWVNTYRAVSYMSPFGGYKRFGLGRENGRRRSASTCRPRACGSRPRPRCRIRS
jgi:(Z)-2-((N-methylformamido)methylene)-5-hydroxybutyrolactone dehydrogenase